MIGLLDFPDVTRNFSDDECRSTEAGAAREEELPSTNAVDHGSASRFHEVPRGLSAQTPMIFFRILS